jgi:hypothetical protein
MAWRRGNEKRRRIGICGAAWLSIKRVQQAWALDIVNQAKENKQRDKQTIA